MLTRAIALLLLMSSTAFARAELDVDKSSVYFGSIRVNDWRTEWITVRNRGDETLQGINVSGGDFNFRVWNRCPYSLSPYESCTIQVEFRPDREGSFSTSIWISANFNNRSVWLNGYGSK